MSADNFNSIKVRLEPFVPAPSIAKGRNFNSIKVRLELSTLLLFSKTLSYFNSIKVRLEHGIKLAHITILEFQFHKGTIRTS